MRDPSGIDAEEPDRRLLVRVQEAGRIREVVKARVAGYQPAVIPPIEGDPGQFQPRLILKMGCLIERLVVVDAKNFSARNAGAQTGNLWREIPRPDGLKHGQCPKAGGCRDAYAHPKAVHFLTPPRNR